MRNRNKKGISRLFHFFFFLKAEAKWKLSVMAGALPWGQDLGDLLALVAEVSHSANLGRDPAGFWWLSLRTMWPGGCLFSSWQEAVQETWCGWANPLGFWVGNNQNPGTVKSKVRPEPVRGLQCLPALRCCDRVCVSYVSPPPVHWTCDLGMGNSRGAWLGWSA